jgi:hypothetical protein
MSKSRMWGHFRYLRFKTFPMTPRTPQCEVFCPLLSSSEHSGVPEDSNSRLFQVLGFTPTLGQSRVATLLPLQSVESQGVCLEFLIFLLFYTLDSSWVYQWAWECVIFFHFSHDMSYISPFFLMSNEIILYQILCRFLKFFFFTYKSENNKIHPRWAIFYQWPKIPRNLTFWNFLHCNKAFGSCHIHTIYTR